MKVLHLATTDYGGAYKACERINESLLKNGIESIIYVREKTNINSAAFPLYRNIFSKLASKICNMLNLLLSKNDITSDYFGLNLSKRKEIQEVDIIILHWVNSFVSYTNIERLLKLGKPIVWVMHDMWLLTGGCHCDFYCGAYTSGCSSCQRANTYFQKRIVAKNVQKKFEATHKGALYVVGPSDWIVKEASKSIILHDIPLIHIPNPVNNNIFHRDSNIIALKTRNGIGKEKKVILFGADNAKRDTNKGIRYLIEALDLLDPSHYMLLLFGRNDHYLGIPKEYEVKCFGFVKDELKLAEIYNMADVFVTPSLQETFGYTTAEALHCGIPVVAFDIGGNKEQINHKKNGYLAPLYNVQELGAGIKYCTSKNFIFEEQTQSYSYEKIGMLYKNLFNEIGN